MQTQLELGGVLMSTSVVLRKATTWSLAMLLSSPNPTFLAAISVGGLNAALLSSASAATCITSVTPTFTNVISDVTGAAGQTVVTSVTPSFATLTPATNRFLTSANVTTGNAVTSVTTPPSNQTTITGITPTPGLPTPTPTFYAAAFSPDFPALGTNPGPAPSLLPPATITSGTGFAFDAHGDTTDTSSSGIQLVTSSNAPIQILSVPFVSGSPAAPQTVLTGVTTASGGFLTTGTTAPTFAPAITGISVTPGASSTTPNALVNGVGVTTAPILTDVTPTFVPVVSNVTASNSGASASATSLGCGVNASANGTSSLAVGTNAAAGTNSVALGQNAQALGVGSTAIGEGASTGSFNNAMALGNGAVATRNNQVVIGNSSNTYTTPGITSAASRAAQVGPLQVVTSDANGNLATDGGAIFNNLNNLNQQLANVDQNLRRLDGGVAMAMALGGVYLPEHQTVAIHADFGFYNGAQAFAIQAIGRINQTFTVNGGVAFDVSGTGNGVGGRVGLSAGW